jgi:hypothetical protein
MSPRERRSFERIRTGERYQRTPDSLPSSEEIGDGVHDVLAPAQLSIQWLDTAAIFTPQPTPNGVVEGLQLGPGRPLGWSAPAGGAKTLTMQAALLDMAAGRAVWGRFPVARALTVRALDYDQGRIASCRRFQRLAAGAGIAIGDLGARLQFVCRPGFTLTDARARSAFLELADGADVLAIDALRSAAPTIDENASEIRRYVDLLSEVSEASGCAIWLLLHTGKPSAPGEAPRGPRGSSGIRDALGALYELQTVGAGQVRRVRQTKASEHAIGPAIADFSLQIEDVPDVEVFDDAGRAYPGVRVVARDAEAALDNAPLAERVLAALAEHGPSTLSSLREHTRTGPKQLNPVLNRLCADGRVSRAATTVHGRERPVYQLRAVEP